MSEDLEIWKPLMFLEFGFERHYDVSNYGRIRSWHIRRHRSCRAKQPTILTGSKDSWGYLQVSILDNEHRRCSPKIHKLIAHIFLGPKPEGLEINHKDGDKLNNRINNLEYVTRKENERHAWKTGLKKSIVRKTINDQKTL